MGGRIAISSMAFGMEAGCVRVIIWGTSIRTSSLKEGFFATS